MSRAGGPGVDTAYMIRRHRTQPVALPDPALMALVESTGASARSAVSFRDAVDVVLREVAVAGGWCAGHALVPGDVGGEWVSLGPWYGASGALRTVCADGPSAAPRGPLALALHMESTHWAGDLASLRGTPRYAAAAEAGAVAAVVCPVYAGGRAVALLEWYLPSAEPPPRDLSHALGHLSGVLTEVAERPPPRVPSQRQYAPLRETLRWVTEDGVVSRLLAC